MLDNLVLEGENKSKIVTRVDVRRNLVEFAQEVDDLINAFHIWSGYGVKVKYSDDVELDMISIDVAIDKAINPLVEIRNALDRVFTDENGVNLLQAYIIHERNNRFSDSDDIPF